MLYSAAERQLEMTMTHTSLITIFQENLGGCHGAKCVCWFYEASIPVNDKEEKELECGPMPNVMAALPNTSGALC